MTDIAEKFVEDEFSQIRKAKKYNWFQLFSIWFCYTFCIRPFHPTEKIEELSEKQNTKPAEYVFINN